MFTNTIEERCFPLSHKLPICFGTNYLGKCVGTCMLLFLAVSVLQSFEPGKPVWTKYTFVNNVIASGVGYVLVHARWLSKNQQLSHGDGRYNAAQPFLVSMTPEP